MGWMTLACSSAALFCLPGEFGERRIRAAVLQVKPAISLAASSLENPGVPEFCGLISIFVVN